MEDRQAWDARHAARADAPLAAPDPFVVEALERLGPGAGRRAVDLACGAGRHALLLAAGGWRTEAWDASAVALADLARRAREAQVRVATRRVELEDGAGVAPPARFDLALVVNFLDRGLLAALPRLVVPGGHALFATFTLDRPGAKPRPARCLRPGELARGLAGFETVLVQERDGRAGILARRAPRSTADGDAEGAR